MAAQKASNWGGKRPGSGRSRINLHLDRETAINLRLLANRWGKEPEEAVKELVEAEWHKIEEIKKHR